MQHQIKSAVRIIFLDVNKYIAMDYLVMRVQIYEKALTGKGCLIVLPLLPLEFTGVFSL